MTHLKPPLRCPCCGEEIEEAVKRWVKHRFSSGRVLRHLIGLAATYHCGARIEAQYIVDTGLRGHIGAARWRLVVTAGCIKGVADVLPGISNGGRSRRCWRSGPGGNG